MGGEIFLTRSIYIKSPLYDATLMTQFSRYRLSKLISKLSVISVVAFISYLHHKLRS